MKPMAIFLIAILVALVLCDLTLYQELQGQIFKGSVEYRVKADSLFRGGDLRDLHGNTTESRWRFIGTITPTDTVIIRTLRETIYNTETWE